MKEHLDDDLTDIVAYRNNLERGLADVIEAHGTGDEEPFTTATATSTKPPPHGLKGSP